MRKLLDKIENGMIRAKLGLGRFAKEERGDTNFISIAIILVVVLAVAVVFIKFGGQIKTKFETAVNNLLGTLG